MLFSSLRAPCKLLVMGILQRAAFTLEMILRALAAERRTHSERAPDERHRAREIPPINVWRVPQGHCVH